MSTELVLTLGLAGWVSVGLVLSLVMGRRGRSPAAWLIIGVLLGPLAIPVALDARWRRHPDGVAVLATAPAGLGPLSVLAAIDGSEEAVTALERAVALFGDRIGRLTLAYVTDYDAAEDAVLYTGDEARAREWMADARAAVAGLAAEECVLMGDPAGTLTRLARDEGYDVLVVGSRGRGLSPRLFGSVAGSLARSSPVPVLIGGQHHTIVPADEPLAAGAQPRPER